MPRIERRGLMLVLSSPSGAGKSSIARALVQEDANLIMSVSVTTRPPRPGEVDGRDYHFVDEPTFAAMVQRAEFLEHATVFSHHYGTPRASVMTALGRGHDVLFDVDWQGARQMKRSSNGDLVSVFILPPSREELERRLRGRRQDTNEVIQARMAQAAEEIAHWQEYDYVVVNHILEKAVADVRTILAAERLRRQRQIGLAAFVAQMCR